PYCSSQRRCGYGLTLFWRPALPWTDRIVNARNSAARVLTRLRATASRAHGRRANTRPSRRRRRPLRAHGAIARKGGCRPRPDRSSRRRSGHGLTLFGGSGLPQRIGSLSARSSAARVLIWPQAAASEVAYEARR